MFRIWFGRSRRICGALFIVASLAFSGGCALLGTRAYDAAAEGEESYEAAFLEAEILRAEGKFPEAIERLSVLAAEPDCPPEILVALAESHLGIGEADKCLAALATAIERYPDFNPSYELRATLHRRLGENEKAIADLEAVLSREPDNARVLEDLGMLRLRSIRDWKYEEGKDTDVARLIAVYNRLAELKSGSQKVLPLVILSSVYTQVGQHEKAVANAKQAVELRAQDIRGHVALGEAYEGANDGKQAIEAYRQALLIEPENAQIRKKVEELIVRTKFEGGKLKFYEELARDFPRVKEIQQVYGDELLKAKKWSEASAHYSRMRELWGDDHDVKVLLTRALIQEGKLDDALALVKELLEENLTTTREMLEFADALRQAGRIEPVMELLERAAEAQGGEPRLRIALAMVQIEAGKREEAARTLEAVMESGAQMPEIALRLLVDIYAGKGDFASAHKAVDKFLASASGAEAESGRNVKAWVYWKSGEPVKAIEVLEGLHGANPKNFEVVEFLAETYGEVGSFDKAQGLLEASQKELGKEFDDQVLFLRARLYRKQEDIGSAIETIEKLLARHADNDEYLLVAGEYYYLGKKMDQAEKVLRRAIEVNPLNSEAYNSLGYFFAEAGIKLDEAEKLILKALELRPGAGHILDSLGWVYFQRGDYGKAVETLEKAIAALGAAPDPVVLEHLGDAYAKDGKMEKARKAWSDALKLDPKSKTLASKVGPEISSPNPAR